MRSPFLLLTVALGPLLSQAGADYAELVAHSKPAAHWSLDNVSAEVAASGAAGVPTGRVQGKLATALGPRPPAFPEFAANNNAALFGAPGAFIRIADPGAKSAFDFSSGDTITLEAWVQCRAIKDGQQTYIVGKGRTQNPGVAAHNQNWALRLRGANGTARVSFLFRDERNRSDAGDADWHRWTSDAGFVPDDGWHHVAVSYTFGDPESARGYIDGVPAGGTWDMGGPTALGPVVDNDEVWIGSSMGGAAGSTFAGAIDEVAIHRTALTPDQIKARNVRVGPALELKTTSLKGAVKPAPEGDPVPPPIFKAGDLPPGLVRVEILEHAGQQQQSALTETQGGNDSAPAAKGEGGVEASWSTLPGAKTDEYTEPAFAFSTITAKYNPRGVKVDRSQPFLVRAAAKITLPPGEHRLLLRALAGARLAIDGEQIAITEHLKRKYGDAEEVPDQAEKQLVPGLRLLPPGHREAFATVRSDGHPRVLTLEAFVGAKAIRPEIGELFVAVESGGRWEFLRPDGAAPAQAHTGPTEAGWEQWAEAQRERVAGLDAERRRNPEEEAYWALRHRLAREHAKPAPAVPGGEARRKGGGSAVDAFIEARLAEKGTAPAPLADDAAFLRRVTLDTVGLLPTAGEVAEFLADPSPDRRARVIERLLADPRWADRWTPYWQDVLAENPNMLKGTLNNTGPFRWWIHDALRDNKPFDRFVTELIAMEGSAQYGGTAGFAIATQNDLPMAAKGQIVASAFMAMEMKCARCHDAPSHPFDQKDLLGIAAMLQRATIKVPETSLSKGLSKNSHVTVSLRANEPIEPHWPFGDAPSEPLPGVLRREGDSRERLAAILTDPRNERFAQVIVNRLWKELIGIGIVEPVDDWEDTRPSHKELLAWLAHEFVTHGYDLKHVARLILNSETYQRLPNAESSRITASGERLFIAPARRRMTAEQLVDSLFAIAGKELASEPLTMDPEDRQPANDHGNLGVPRRAWEFAALANERDRPALAKPRAQVVTDVLAAFGWRESRPDPRSTRDHDTSVLQPALLANGTLGSRIVRLSDDSAFTALALADQPVETLVTELFLRTLSRPPTEDERGKFAALLSPGYAQRLTGAPPAPPRPRNTKAVSWANHLHAEATRVILAVEEEVKAGDPPTPRLRADWRARMEDALWALIVSPEFVHLP